MYQLTGKIKTINAVKQVSETFKVKEFVVTVDDGKYPQHIQLQAANEKCDALDAFTIGSDVTVSFNLRGREWTNQQGEVKYFNSLDAWKIEGASAGTSPTQTSAQATTQPQTTVTQAQVSAAQIPVPQDGNDDLPF